MSSPVLACPGLLQMEGDRPHLIGSRCADCGEIYFPSAASCTRCRSTQLEPHDLGSSGVLWSWTIQGFLPKPPYNSGETADTFQPYGVGYVEMACGIKVESRLTVADPAALAHRHAHGADPGALSRGRGRHTGAHLRLRARGRSPERKRPCLTTSPSSASACTPSGAHDALSRPRAGRHCPARRARGRRHRLGRRRRRLRRQPRRRQCRCAVQRPGPHRPALHQRRQRLRHRRQRARQRRRGDHVRAWRDIARRRGLRQAPARRLQPAAQATGACRTGTARPG